MYVVTTYQRLNSGVTISRHPIAIRLENGSLIACDSETRLSLLEDLHLGLIKASPSGYIHINPSIPSIKFKTISSWENDSLAAGIESAGISPSQLNSFMSRDERAYARYRNLADMALALVDENHPLVLKEIFNY